MALLRATSIPLVLLAAILLASVAVQGEESAATNRNLLAADHHNFKHGFTKAHMHTSRHGSTYTIHAFTKGRTHDKLGHAGRKLMSLATPAATQEPTAIVPEQAEGKDRSLLKADTAASANHGSYGYGGNPWSTQLIPHGDHMDRVAVYDTTRASSWENHRHYGGWGRKLMSLVMASDNAAVPADNAAVPADNTAAAIAPKQEAEAATTVPTADTTAPVAPMDKSAKPTPADTTEQAEEGKGRSLLKADTAASANHDGYGYGGYGGNPWSTELIPHGDHMDRVAVYDTTRASAWENYNHYGRKLAQATTTEAESTQEDAAPNTVEPVTQPATQAESSTQDGAAITPKQADKATKEPTAAPVDTTTTPEQSAKEEGASKGRSLLKADTAASAASTNHGGYGGYGGYGGNPWSTQLIPHGDHMDRVAVYDSTRASAWENHRHYGGWGRKLAQATTTEADNTQEFFEDAAPNTVEEPQQAAATAAQPSRALLASNKVDNHYGHSHYNNYNHGHNSYRGGYHGGYNNYHGHSSYHGGYHGHGWGR